MNVRDLSLVTLSRPPRAKNPAGSPALVLLHGVGSNEEDLFGLAPAIDERLWVLAARAPIVLGPSQFAWYRIRFDGPEFVTDATEIESARVRLLGYLAEVRTELQIEAGQIVLGGFSQGAIMSTLVALTTDGEIGGLVAMSGRTLPQARENVNAATASAALPAAVTHGVYDDVVPIRFGRETRECLEAASFRVDYAEFPTSHGIGEENLDFVTRWLSDWVDQRFDHQ